MNFTKIPIYALAATFVVTSTLVFANEEEGELEEAELFFELNDTDGDLGIHGKMDGDAWKELEIEAPNGREILEIDVKSRLKRQGLTELFFESAEPTFDELGPKRFFKRFPEGIYEIEAVTLDGGELENEVYLSHVIPAAPVVLSIGDRLPKEDCDAEDLPEVSAPVILSWAAVTTAHEDLGKATGSDLADHGISVIYYEVVIEIDESPFKATIIVPSDVTQVELPEAITNLVGETDEGEGEFKFEILVRTDNGDGNPGNKSAVENCFVLAD